MSSYDQYVREEWSLFAANPARAIASREVTATLNVSRVLDVGCGAGQELRPFLTTPQVFGVGIDSADEAGLAGRALFARDQAGSRVAFVRASAERLPLGDSTFDVVICRIALPYMDNAAALMEISRVLRPAGVLLLKFHHARFYIDELVEACRAGHVKSAIHACRVLVAGAIYHLTGTQPRNRLTGGETFQTLWLLRRELRRSNLEIQSVLSDSVPAAPSVLVGRPQAD